MDKPAVVPDPKEVSGKAITDSNCVYPRDTIVAVVSDKAATKPCCEGIEAEASGSNEVSVITADCPGAYDKFDVTD